MKNCRHCSEEIQDNAIKCSHCGTYQNWRRHLTLATTTVSVTVAIIAIMGALIPLTLEAWKPKEARVSVRWVSFENEGIQNFMVSNVGNRPAAIAQVSIGVKAGEINTTITPQAAFELSGGSSGAIVEPGGIYILKVFLKRNIGELTDCYVTTSFFEFPSRHRAWRFEPRNRPSCASLSLKETGTDIQIVDYKF